MKYTNKTVAFALVLVTLMTLQGCIGQEEAAPTRILRVTFAWPTYIDPAVGSDFSSSTSIVNLYDSLVYPKPDGTIQPHLAKEWDVSADGLTWTFTLKEGVKFHDGSELMAEDVAYSMDRLITIGEGYSYLFAPYIATTTALDDYTVEIKLSKPIGPFLIYLIRLYVLNKDLVEEHIVTPGPYGDKGDYGKDWLLTHDAGSGAYKVKEFRLEEELVIERFEDYWGDIKPNAPDEVHLIGTTEAVTVRTGISNRELEISDQWQTEEALGVLDAIEGVDICTWSTGGTFYYMMHTKKPPTDDIHFRKAMAYAVDYEAVVNQVFPGRPLAKGPVSSVLPGFNPDVFQPTRDLAKAEQELKLSKYYNQLDDYPVEVGWVTEVPDEEKVALLFAANMAEIGIKVEISNIPWLSMVERTADIETSPNIATIFVAPHYPEAGSILESRYHSKSAATWEQNEWLLNETIDAMIEDALGTVDTQERYKKYQDIQEVIAEMCPSIFLFENVAKSAYQSYYVEWPTAKGPEYWNAVMGYNMDYRNIEVDMAKREELLGA
ncbi:MAG: ABC transporter substrate-binding protein [Candidatus Heimdallarchaeota archaeon]